MYADTPSVGSLQPDTIGLSECGFLCILVRNTFPVSLRGWGVGGTQLCSYLSNHLDTWL